MKLRVHEARQPVPLGEALDAAAAMLPRARRKSDVTPRESVPRG